MAVIFTCSIDDGHPLDSKMADLLHKHGLNGTFFIPIKNREGRDVLSHQAMRAIGQQFEIASHTYDHCFLQNIHVTEARFQIMEGKKQLEDILGKEILGFCYPGGKYQKSHAAMVEASGFQYARTTMNLCFSAGKNAFEMPTTLQFYPHSRAVYVRNFIKAGNWENRCKGLKVALKQKNWIDRSYALFDHACEHGLKFHLWGHSYDIDMLDAWHELDQFLAYVSGKVALQNRLNNGELAKRAFSA